MLRKTERSATIFPLVDAMLLPPWEGQSCPYLPQIVRVLKLRLTSPTLMMDLICMFHPAIFAAMAFLEHHTFAPLAVPMVSLQMRDQKSRPIKVGPTESTDIVTWRVSYMIIPCLWRDEKPFTSLTPFVSVHRRRPAMLVDRFVVAKLPIASETKVFV